MAIPLHSKKKSANERTPLNICADDVGRFVRVVFDDVGATDGIVTRVDDRNDFRFLAFGENEDQHNNGSPAVLLGDKISASMFM